MRTTLAGLAVVALTLTGCSSGDADSTPAAPPSQAGSGAAGPSAAVGSGGGTVLTGTVGTPDQPDSFVITLTDSGGQPVKTLPAGRYSVQVKDLSEIHNFRLTGGDVDEATTVPEVADRTFDVDLQAGSYTFVCDPHPGMVGTFTVT